MKLPDGTLPFYSRISRLTLTSGVLFFAFAGLAFAFHDTLGFWTAFAALLVPSIGVFVSVSLQQRERARVFEDFNRRTWEWRERWADEHATNAWSPLAIDLYTHLSAEKFHAYRRGLVDDAVWTTWTSEMASYFARDSFVERWHLGDKTPLYGFQPSLVTPDFPKDLDAVISRKIARQERDAS